MDCAAGVAFASILSAYTHYCARCLLFVNCKAVLVVHLTSFLDDPMKGPSQKVCVFLPVPFCAGWANAMVLSYSNYDVDERTH